MNLPFFIARRYLVRQKGAFSSFIIRLAIAATALSVAVMIVSLAIIGGFRHAIQEKMYSFLGHVHVEPGNPNRSQSLSPDAIKYDPALMRFIAHLPHVRQVSPFVQRPAIIQVPGRMEGALLKGINAAYTPSPAIALTGKKIDFSDTDYAKQIIISQAIADKLNIDAGDTVQLDFLDKSNMFPRIRRVRVAGMYHTGMDEIDRQYCLCDMRLLQRVNGWNANDISGYQVDLNSGRYSDTTANAIFDYLRSTPYIHSSLTTYTMNDIFPSIFEWLNLLNVNVRVILIIMAIVAVINLASVLMILIVEQLRMVGLLKAMGMALGGIQRIFLYHATIIAGVGILVGNVLALALCWLQETTGLIKLQEDTYYIKEVAVRISWWQVLTVDVATLLICVLCMWLPTLYIRRIKPARVLQFK